MRTPGPIRPCPTGRLFLGGAVPGTSCRATIAPSLRDTLQQAAAKVHHHWVTGAGDTIYLEDAIATAFQIGAFSGVYVVAGNSYTVKIIGGNGRFAGATGD
jgi:hypothetical protein